MDGRNFSLEISYCIHNVRGCLFNMERNRVGNIYHCLGNKKIT